MRKKKGGLLLLVIMLIAVVGILSVPMISMVGQNFNISNRGITDIKADELAYGGFKIVKKYIIQDKNRGSDSTFQNYLTEDLDGDGINDAGNVVINLPYGTDGDTVPVDSRTEVVFENSKIKEVHITTTATYGKSTETYEETVYFSTQNNSDGVIEVATSKIFPNSTYYEIDTRVDKNNNIINNWGSVDKMKARMEVNEIPAIADSEHIDFLTRNNTVEPVLLDGTSKALNESKIQTYVAELASNVDRKENSIHVINLKEENNWSDFDGYIDIVPQNDNEIEIDLSNLGIAGENDVNLIFITDTRFAFGGLNTNRDRPEEVIFKVKGGHVHFVYATDSTSTDTTINMNITSRPFEAGAEAGQVTIGITGKGYTLNPSYGEMKNIFIYAPQRQLTFARNNSSPSGGIVTYRIIEANNVGPTFIPWKGVSQIMAYNLDITFN